MNATEEWAQRQKWFTAAALVGLVVTALLILRTSASRPFWFDESFTFYLCRLPSFGDLMAALRKGVDLQPPGFFLATVVAQRIFGYSEVATRLPSLFGFLLMMVCVFLFVRRRTNALYGIVAALFPVVTEAFYYSCEARPYGLVLGFSALALLCWQEATSGTHRKLGLVGLWLSLSLAVSSHYYAVMIFIPIAIAELVRALEWRRLDIPVAIAAVLGELVALVYVPLVRHGMSVFDKHPWTVTTLRFVYEAPEYLLAPVTLSLALGFLVLYLQCWINSASRAAAPIVQPRAGLSTSETSACIGFLLLPAAGYLMTRTVSHLMTARYVLPFVIGFAILFACGFYHATNGRAFAALALIALLGGTFVARRALPRVQAENEFATLKLPDQNRDLPVVAASPLYFVPALHYGNPEVKSRILYLRDSDLALRHLGQNSIDILVTLGSEVFHWPVVPFREFMRTHPRFFLISSAAENWLDQELHEDGSHLELIDKHGEGTLFLVTQAH